MARPLRHTLIVIALVSCGAVAPAAAQIGSLFGEPPRPPGAVPGAQQQQQIPAQQFPQFPTQQQQQPPPARQNPPQQARTSAPPQGGIQSQPLAPPPGAAQAPPPPQQPPQQQAQQPVQGQRPQQLAPAQPATGAARAPAAGPPPQAAAPLNDATIQPGDEVITEPPAQKVENPTAIFAGLDKITGRITSFDVAIGETVQFGALQVTPRACYTRPPTEAANTDGFVEVDEVTLKGQVRRIFAGWMFAASPGLHAVEHPIYDVWLTDCKGAAVAAAAEPPKPATPAAKPAVPTTRRPTRPPLPR